MTSVFQDYFELVSLRLLYGLDQVGEPESRKYFAIDERIHWGSMWCLSFMPVCCHYQVRILEKNLRNQELKQEAKKERQTKEPKIKLIFFRNLHKLHYVRDVVFLLYDLLRLQIISCT